LRKIKGYALVITIMIICALFFFTLQYVRFFAAERMIAGRGEETLIAQAAASAGIDDALGNLRKNIDWKAGFSGTRLAHSGAEYRMSFSQAQTAVPFSTNNSASDSPVTGSGGRIVPPRMIHLVSVGRYGKAAVPEECMVTSGPTKLFRGAAFVKETIRLTGNAYTDSFNSAKKTYAQEHFDYGGDIGTNLDSESAVTLNGNNSNVQGKISVGPKGVEQKSITGGTCGQNYDSFENLTEPIPMPVISGNAGPSSGAMSAAGIYEPGTYSSVSCSGGTIELKSGAYVITGDFKMSGKGQLKITGPTRIYVAGNIDITGNGILNTDGKPRNLLIFGGEGTTSVKVSGNGAIYLGLYAPNAEIDITGGGKKGEESGIFGAIAGKSLKMTGNGTFHYDKDIENVTGGAGVPTLKARW
jgi:hypothetical protein